MLKEFYAVTPNSLYRIVADDGNGGPCIFLIRSKSVRSRRRRFSAIKLIKGDLLVVAKWLQFINPVARRGHQPERRLEKVPIPQWRGGTDRIVVLFPDAEEAKKCFKSSGLEYRDSRWLEETARVIVAIGDAHPVFSICHEKGRDLMED